MEESRPQRTNEKSDHPNKDNNNNNEDSNVANDSNNNSSHNQPSRTRANAVNPQGFDKLRFREFVQRFLRRGKPFLPYAGVCNIQVSNMCST